MALLFQSANCRLQDIVSTSNRVCADLAARHRKELLGEGAEPVESRVWRIGAEHQLRDVLSEVKVGLAEEA